MKWWKYCVSLEVLPNQIIVNIKNKNYLHKGNETSMIEKL